MLVITAQTQAKLLLLTHSTLKMNFSRWLLNKHPMQPIEGNRVKYCSFVSLPVSIITSSVSAWSFRNSSFSEGLLVVEVDVVVDDFIVVVVTDFLEKILCFPEDGVTNFADDGVIKFAGVTT